MTHPLLIADIFEWLGRALASIAQALLKANMNLIKSAPDPQIHVSLPNSPSQAMTTAAWFGEQYEAMARVAFVLLVPIVIAAVIGLIMRGDLFQLIRTVIIGTAVAIFGTFAALSVIGMCINVNNEMTEALISGPRGAEASISRYLDAMNATSGNSLGEVALNDGRKVGLSLGGIIVYLITIVGCLFLWVEMIFRQLMIYLGVLFLPFAFAAYIWGPLRIWLYMLAEICVTMVFAKFIIAAVVTFGFQAITVGAVGDAVGDTNVATTAGFGLMLAGALVIFAACFAVPTIIAFVMQPTHAILQRKQVWSMMPTSSRNMYGRSILHSGREAMNG